MTALSRHDDNADAPDRTASQRNELPRQRWLLPSANQVSWLQQAEMDARSEDESSDRSELDEQDAQELATLAGAYDKDEAHTRWEERLAHKEYLDEVDTSSHDPAKAKEWDEKNWSRSESLRWRGVAEGERDELVAAAHLISVRQAAAAGSPTPDPTGPRLSLLDVLLR